VPSDAWRESEGKKTLYWYTRLGKIAVVEAVFTRGRRGPELRPFAASAEVVCRGYSPALQRAMTDFGADEPFAGAAAKLREHYGIDVPVGAVRTITEQHGAAILASQPPRSPWPETPGVPQLIAELDGSMVPQVETGPPAGDDGSDRRKTRHLSWTEARLCLVREPGSVTPRFGATMGTVEVAGDQLWACAVAAGVGHQTRIHGVGDGAPWIADQVERTLGAQATYLIDFYHLCDYLAAAAAVVAAPAPAAWLTEKKTWLKANRWADVLDALRPAVEPADVADEAAPVRACVRYLSNRTGSLDYASALAAELPIGSGEIESAHRYIIQSRLKRAGTWWTADNLANMLALRVLRANREWDAYWTQVNQEAA
jgi:hypothetical protein